MSSSFQTLRLLLSTIYSFPYFEDDTDDADYSTAPQPPDVGRRDPLMVYKYHRLSVRLKLPSNT